MFKSRQEDYINPKDVDVNYLIEHPNSSIQHRYSFKYCEVPSFGFGPGGTKVISCDEYFDHKLLVNASTEFLQKKILLNNKTTKMIPFGLVPEKINQQKCLDSYLINLKKYFPNLEYIEETKHIHHYHDFKNFVVKKFSLNCPWKGVIHTRNVKSFFEKNQPSLWKDFMVDFPLLIKFVESLPFKHIGYAMIMQSNANTKLDIHRDIYPRNHSCHHINFSLDLKPKSFFIYDAISNKKYYKPPEAYSYFFNETDLHGSDYLDEERFTLRVDGEFEHSFAKKIGLIDGVTFDWSFDHVQDFIKQNGIPKILGETDI